MTKDIKRGGKTTAAESFFTRRNAAWLAVGITVVIIFSFSLGFMSSKIYRYSLAKQKREAESQPAPSYPSVTAERLDAGVIMGESASNVEASAPEKFTFPETLTKEAPPAPSPYQERAGAAPAQAKDDKKETVKPEEKKPSPAPARTASIGKAPSPPSPAAAKPAAVKKPQAAQGGGSYTVQVGSFASEKDAERLKARLVARDYNAYTQTFAAKGKTWHRVRVGVFGSEAEARKAAAKLEKEEKLPTLVAAYQR